MKPLVKVYSKQEISALNYLRLNKEKVMAKCNRIYTFNGGEERYIDLKVNQGQTEIEGRINWIDDIGEGFFLMGLTLLGGDYEGAGGVYVSTLISNEGFKVLFNASEWSMDDLILRGKEVLNK